MQQRARSVGLVLALAVGMLVAGCRDEGPTALVHTAGGAGVRIALEVARTPEAQRQGLMYRTTLADDHGMLFVFAAESEHEFWMKNTLIPLDMVFIAGDGRIVGVHANATPLSTVPIGVGRPSRWVLEVPGGYAARRGIAPGDRVELLHVAAP